MWRLCGLIVGLGILVASFSQTAWATSPPVGDKQHYLAPQSLIIQVKQLSERQKCKALNRCRQKYTWCFHKLEVAHKNIEKHKIECVKPYQKCINKTFSGFDFMFTRWFNPSYLDCKQFPN